MKTEEKEAVEIEILNDDFVSELDSEVQENIVFLVEKVPSKELLPLNPLVNKMAEIQKLAIVKYDPEKEKESIQQYKDSKSEIRSFRARVKEVKKLLKADILKAGKALDGIEKSFIEKATEVHNQLDLNFDVYLKAEKKKKADALAKKEKEQNEAIQKLQDEKDAAVALVRKNGAYNKIKYEVVIGYQSDFIQGLDKMNMASLKKLYEDLGNLKFNTVLTTREALIDWDYLEDVQQMEINKLWSEGIKKLRETVMLRLSSLENEDNSKLEIAREQGKIEGSRDPSRAHILTPTEEAPIPSNPNPLVKNEGPNNPPPPPTVNLEAIKAELKYQRMEVENLISYFRVMSETDNYPMDVKYGASTIVELATEIQKEIDDIIS